MTTAPFDSESLAVFAVLPTIALGGPVTLFALLFPALCGGLMLFLRRWRGTLFVLSMSSTAYLLHSWFYSYICDSWWESQLLLWLWTTSLVFLVLLSRRKGDADNQQASTTGDAVLLGVIATLCTCSIAYGLLHRATVLATWIRPFAMLGAGAGAGLWHELRIRTSRNKSVVQLNWRSDTMTLLAMGMMSASFTANAGWHLFEADSLQLCWKFVSTREGRIDSSPLIVGDRVFVGTASHSGELYCVDRKSGQPLWAFSDNERMKPVLSSPCYSDGRIYIGEGYHSDTQCKLYCVDALTGKKLWDFVTRSHTESTPSAVNGFVYFGAGDDGLYCLDSVSGHLQWHFAGPHVDGCPTVVNDRVYAGSGYGSYELFCLEAASGDPIWRVPIEVSSFGSATVVDDDVFFGIGNGSFGISADNPTGALLCLACDTGQIKWRYDVKDAVHATPINVDSDIIFGSRDHHCYCVNKTTGQLRWKRNLGSPIVSAGAVGGRIDTGTNSVYVLTTAGLVSCLDATTGLPYLTKSIPDLAKVTPPFVSSPAVTREQLASGGRCQLYVGGGLSQLVTQPALFCFDTTPSAADRRSEH